MATLKEPTSKQSKPAIVPATIEPLMSLHLEMPLKNVQPKHGDNTDASVCPKCGPTGHCKCVTPTKDGKTNLLHEKDQSQLPTSTTDLSTTNSAGLKETSVPPQCRTNDERSQAQNETGKTEKASAHSEEEEKKFQRIAEDDAAQLAHPLVCLSSSMTENVSQHETKQKDDAAEVVNDENVVIQLETDNKPVVTSDVSADQMTGSTVAEEIACSTDELHQETVTNAQDKLQQLNQNELSVHTNSDDLIQTAASRDELQPDVEHTQVVKGQSDDSIASVVQSTTAGLVEQSLTGLAVCAEDDSGEMSRIDLDTQRAQSGDEKLSEQAQPQMKSAVEKDRRVKHSPQSEKDRALGERERAQDKKHSEQAQPKVKSVVEWDRTVEHSPQLEKDRALCDQKRAQSGDKKHSEQSQSQVKFVVEKDRTVKHSPQSEKDRALCDRKRAQSSDKKLSEQTQPQMKSAAIKDRTVKHSAHVEKDRALCDSRTSREGSSSERMRSHATDVRQRSTRRRQLPYKQDTSSSHQDRQQQSKKMRTDGSIPESKSVTQMQHGDYLSDLDSISSDEEETVVYQDDGIHCCWFCSETHETIPSLLEHLQAAAHEQVLISLNE